MNSILIRLLMSLLTIFTCSNGYDNICPHSSQWNLTSRSYRCVDQKTYICLFDLLESNRTNKTVFRGACGNKDVSKEGTKYILNPNLEQVPCDAIQYQPFTFTTNGSSQCALGKSLCKSSGQILASNGSFFGDASCRCDYTRGFDYIIPPNNPCSCKPAEEDCSCYIRKCDDDKVMIPDYRCVTRVETILPEDIKCPIISRTIPPEETDAVDNKQFQSIPSSRTWSKQASVILIVVVIIFTVLVGFLFFSVPHVTCILLKSKLELSVHRKENKFMIFDGENVKIECNVKSYIPVRSVTWQKVIDGEIIEITPSMGKYEMNCGKRPSLTIDNFNSEDQGKYRCIVRNAVGLRNEMCSSCMNHMSRFDWLTGFATVLQHIPAFHTEDITLHNYGNIYDAILDHRKDKTFTRPHICNTMHKQLRENNIVIITGREGTGKSKFCLELASFYEQNGYMIVKVDLLEKYTIYTNIVDTLLIIDDQCYIEDSLKAFMEHLLPVLLVRNIKVILTCRNLDLEIVRNVPKMDELKGETFIDIDNCLTYKEKEKLLRRYMKANNIAVTAKRDKSNFKDPKILTDFSVPVILDNDAVRIIKNEKPFNGFPLSVSLFCSDRNNLHLGEKYFTNPPKNLYEELKELYKSTRKKTRNEYCILVYIMNDSNHQLDLKNPDLCRKLDEIRHLFFHLKYMHEKSGSNEDQKKSIKKAVHRMNNKYLKFNKGVYEFIHPCLLKAMIPSSDCMIHYVLQFGSLHDITEFIRSEVYVALENEMVIKIDKDNRHLFCERLARHALENPSIQQHVAQYINSYLRSSDNYLVNEIFRHIEFILFKSLEVDTGHPLSLDNESLPKHSINLEGPVHFSKVTMLVHELTYTCRDPWIYGPGSSDFLILSALVSAAMNRYATERVQTFKILLDEFQNRIHKESFVKLWSKRLDMHGNTFFHYLMQFSEKEVLDIIHKIVDGRYVYDTKKDKKDTPFDIATYLGKNEILYDLDLRLNIKKKLGDGHKRLAERGRDEFYDKNSKHKSIDHPIVNKRQNDRSSYEILESEDADDVNKR